MGAAIPRQAMTDPTANADETRRPTTAASFRARTSSTISPIPPTSSASPTQSTGTTVSPYRPEPEHPEAREAGEAEPRLGQLEREGGERQDQQEIDHRRGRHAVQHAVDRPQVLEADVDRALERLLLRGRDPRLQDDRTTGRLNRAAVDPSQQVGDRRRRHLRDVAVPRLGSGERPVVPVDVGRLAACLDPRLDRLVESRRPVLGMCQVDGMQRARLAARRDAGQRRRVHQQQPGAAGAGRRRSDPRDRPARSDRRRAERTPPRPRRASPPCRSGGRRWLRTPRRRPGGRSGSPAAGGRSRPSTLSTSKSVGDAAPAARGQSTSSETAARRRESRRMAASCYRPRGRGVSWALSWPEPRNPDATRRTARTTPWPCCCWRRSSRSRRVLIAILIAPPIAGLAFGAEADRRTADGARGRLHADPPLPGAFDDLRRGREDRARHALPRQPRDRGARRHQRDGPERRPRGRGRGVLRARTARLELVHPRACSRTRRPARSSRAVRRSRSSW